MRSQLPQAIALASLLIGGQACSQGHPAGHRHHPKHGHDQDQLAKPFDDIDAYIRHLEQGDRAKWQKPEAVITWLGLAGTETVVDVGAGSGYFAFRLAKALATGRVVATDIEPGMLEHMRAQATKAGVGNLTTALATATDPRIPKEAKLVFLCNVYHHIPDRAAWLRTAKDQMRPGSKLIFLEFTAESPIGPPADIRLSAKALKAELELEGFRQTRLATDLLPYQYAAEFER